MATSVGIIGLGVMGKQMARHLLQAGYEVYVYNRSQPAIDELMTAGAHPAASPAAVAAMATVIITMLPDAPDVELVVLGPHGIVMAAAPETLVIDMSTISPMSARDIAAKLAMHQIHFLDAPVSGGERGAIDATLSIMVGGDENDLSLALPVLSTLGTTITYCGPQGAGQIVKACNQIVVTSALAGLAEALVLGMRGGIAADTILTVMRGGYAQSRVMDIRGTAMARHDFTPGGKTRFLKKDLGIVLDVAQAYGVTLPTTLVTDRHLAELIAQGLGDLDHTALILSIEQRTKKNG